MMMEKKYIRTSGNQIIMFSEGLQHSEFKQFNPISAGYVKISSSFNIDNGCEIKMEAYGESKSLGLQSTPEIDNRLIEVQFLK